MTDSIYAWSQTAASNSNADASINWAEFQDPDTVNDSARQMMARVAAYISDNAPKRASTGTGNAYAVVSDAAGSSLVNGMVICFIADRANTAAATLNVDGLGAKPLRPKASTEFNAGDLIAGQPVIAWYNSSTQEWIALGTGYHVSSTINGLALQSIVALLPKIGDVVLSPDATPAAGRIRLTETTQAVLKTSYPELNTWLSARSYPWGSTATHFNLPPAAGYFLRFAATSASIDTGGARTAGSTQADQIKAHTHTGTTDAAGSHSHNVEYANAAREPGASGQLMSYAGTTLSHATTTAPDHTHTFTTASSGGDEVRVKNVAMHADIIASSAESAAQIAVFGFPYQWDTGTSAADPGAGRVRGNNASLGSITQLYINNSDRWSQSLAALWGALASGNPVHLSRVGAQGNRIIAILNGTPTAGAGFYTLPVSVTVATGSFSNNDSLALEYGLGGATNLGYTPSPTNGVVTSDAGTDATISLANGTNAGLMAPADYTKLAGISGTNTGDQSTFGTIAVSGQSNVVADAANDTLTLVAGTNVTITTNAASDSITISAAGGGGSVATDTIWDAKGDLSVGTGSNTAARLAVGTNGQILVADSATATGLKWAAAAGGGDLLAANNLSDLSNAATARTNLGLAIGTNVQAYSAALAAYPDPTANDADSLGTGAASWSDLFLAEGAVINFDNGDLTVTKKSNSIDFEWTSASSRYIYVGNHDTSASSNAAIILHHGSGTDSRLTATSTGVIWGNVSNQALRIDTNNTPRMTIGASGGFVVHIAGGDPTGGNKGDGTINAGAVYDDNTLLTDYVFDAYFGRDKDYPSRVQAKRILLDPTMFDVEAYASFWREHGRLYGMPDLDDCIEMKVDLPLGDQVQRLMQTVELHAIHIAALSKRIAGVEKK